MPFVNELIPKERYDALRVLARARGIRRGPELWTWTAAAGERALLLFMTHTWGGSYEGTQGRGWAAARVHRRRPRVHGEP